MSDQDEPSSVYNDLRLNGEFCDAVIQVEDVGFQIHKVILCKCSPYFRALFRRWSNPDAKVFNLPGLSPDMMQLIIEFAYSGSVSVTEDNVQELLLAADQLNVMDLVQACCEFLGEQLCPQNCIGIWQFTNICFSSELQRKAYRYIIDHFEEVVSCEEFLQLSVQELSDIIDRDDLSVRKESSVYEAILKWIAHKPEERKGHITVLLSKVRLALTSAEYIRIHVMSNELLENNKVCLPMFRDAMQTICDMITNRTSVSGVYNPQARPRLPTAILLAIGGWSGGDPTNGIEVYDVRADRWCNMVNNLERPRAYHGTAFLNGQIYCVGGFDRVEHFNSVCRLDLSTNTWHEAAPMYCRRCYVSVTVLNGYIYAMGGYDGHTRLNTAERYRPETNQWSLISPMHEQRSDASSTTLHNKVYICGGFNGNECLQTCEYYSPETNQWTMITPMDNRRSGIGIIAHADHVYAVGGFDGNNRLRSAEAYNPETNTWHAVSSMLTPRSNFGIEVIDDQLFVVGGFNGFTTSYNVEFYDATTDEWSEACDMEIFRSALSCCVVYGIPNITEYTFPRDSLSLLESVESED
ncbi:kelch-like protein 10 [Micropterus dolomieu]|uniref:kelch-like protein 10 n=1 Tax=Micropterus dolomieu TaxID=147949 RepID=UPI001E8DFA28|nr:kelch-like protein 10 [Micropterus dolomieu]